MLVQPIFFSPTSNEKAHTATVYIQITYSDKEKDRQEPKAWEEKHTSAALLNTLDQSNLSVQSQGPIRFLSLAYRRLRAMHPSFLLKFTADPKHK